MLLPAGEFKSPGTGAMAEQAVPPDEQRVPGGALEPWTVASLPEPPRLSWRGLPMLIAGEWLFGPAVSAQYGGTLLWLATLSIVAQVFFNLEVMRYALYCGEPIFVGYFRTRPGPKLWVAGYLLLEVCNIWPFMAANAAVPLTAAVLGHLPTDASRTLLGLTLSEEGWVKLVGYVIFLLAFIPLIFGGTIYRMIERLMTTKVILVLGLLGIIAASMVSWDNVREVVTGFFRFGQVPVRADVVAVGPHFTFKTLALNEQDAETRYTMQGTWKADADRPEFMEFIVRIGKAKATYDFKGLDADRNPPRPGDELVRLELLARARKERNADKRFLVEDTTVVEDAIVRIRGAVTENGRWSADLIEIIARSAPRRHFDRLEDVPGEYAGPVTALVENKGMQRVGLVGYIGEHGGLPDLNWAMIVAFIGIAGTGGLANTLSSNYARDKGWGMGRHVGAIPSAIGGHTISLSHVGAVFELTDESWRRWRSWYRHIVRDQAGMWALCCFVGMALPCMMSLEFIRNVPVAGNRAAAMTAAGIAEHHPEHAAFWFSAMLLCAFMVLGPNAVFSGEAISRRWTDVIWTTSTRARKLQGNQVKYIYYAILTVYGLWGLVALSLFNPLQIAMVGAVLQNVALGFAAFHTLYANRTLLPKQLQPGWFMQGGLLYCGAFFLGISMLVLITKFF